jgi:predicted 3-demethylubiquinone-9 3-methyltransferase (glyoxalase superfamily)
MHVKEEGMQKITPFLWFDHQAEEAAHFYCSLFRHAEILRVIRYGGAGPGPKGSIMTVEFRIEGQEFTALNGGPDISFSQAISFVVNCTTQEEVDELWKKLSEGGEQQPCGWLKDRYGVSWQIVPVILIEMLNDPDPEKAARVMTAMLRMGKIEIKLLKKAYAGE